MPLRFLSLLSFCLLWAAAPVSATIDLTQGVDKAFLERLIELSYNMSPEAEVMAETLLEEYPELPVSHFVRSSQLYWMQEYAGVDEELTKRCFKALKRSLKVTKSHFKENKRDPVARFYLAMAEFGMARYHLDRRNWIRGSVKANSGMAHARRILKKHDGFHDAKLSLGLANCYLSETPALMKPFVSLFSHRGDMDTGLAQLHEARENSFFARYEASVYLADVHKELLQDYEAAKRFMAELVERFPQNSMFWRDLAALEMKLENNEGAKTALEAARETPYLGDYPALEVDVYLRSAQVAYNLGDDKSAVLWTAMVDELAIANAGLEHRQSWALLLNGLSSERLGDLDTARSAWERIRKKDNSRAYARAADALERLNGAAKE